MSDEPGHEPQNIGDYPLHMVAGIVPPDRTSAAIHALTSAGFADTAIDSAEGNAAADAIVGATERGVLGQLSKLLPSEEHEQRADYVDALRAGDAVVRVVVSGAEQKRAAAEALLDNGGHFINYYDEWTVEQLAP